MTERRTPHVDLGGYLVGALSGAELEAFQRHVDTCPECQAELRALGGTVALARRAADPFEVPAGLEARVLEAVRAAATAPPAAAVERAVPTRWRPARLALASAAAAAIAAAGVYAGSAIDNEGLPGERELAATLRGPGGKTASAVVQKTGIGRVIVFDTTELPILPKGQYYELWWVGPGDRPGKPNRISAGTFHPDEQGRSKVRFAAAVDPEKYPNLAVTAEPGDGDPSPSGPDILRTRR